MCPATTWPSSGGTRQKAPLPALAPHTKGQLAIKGDWKRTKEVRLWLHYRGRLVDQYRIVLPQKSAAALCPAAALRPAARPVIQSEADTVTVTAGKTQVRFSRREGTLTSVARDGEVLVSGMELHAGDAPLPAWRKERAVFAAMDGDRAVVLLRGSYGGRVSLQYIFRIYGDERLSVEYRFAACALQAQELSELGLRFAVPASVDRVHWDADTLWSLYPDDHMGRPCGTAYRVCRAARQAGYGAPPAWDWKDDMYDPFLYPPGAASDGLATRDFLTMRTHIRSYQAEFAGFTQAILVEAAGDTAVRVAPGPDSAGLIVNRQWWYPALDWGNDTGKPVRLSGSGVRGVVQCRLIDRRPDTDANG